MPGMRACVGGGGCGWWGSGGKSTRTSCCWEAAGYWRSQCCCVPCRCLGLPRRTPPHHPLPAPPARPPAPACLAARVAWYEVPQATNMMRLPLRIDSRCSTRPPSLMRCSRYASPPCGTGGSAGSTTGATRTSAPPLPRSAITIQDQPINLTPPPAPAPATQLNQSAHRPRRRPANTWRAPTWPPASPSCCIFTRPRMLWKMDSGCSWISFCM